MSRHIRSALLLSQAVATAGPSSIPHISYQATRATPLQVRHASSLSSYLPSWILPKRSGETNAPAEDPNEIVQSGSGKGTSDGVIASSSTGSLFDDVAAEAEVQSRKKHTEHRYKSAHHKISLRKLNDLSRQIAGLPIDEAIVQMDHSDKRASGWIKSTLALARDHAIDKGLRRSRLIVGQSWVSKGLRIARVDIKGRGRAGRKHHNESRIHLLLTEGRTQAELMEKKYQKEMGRVRSAGVVREQGVLRRKVISGWTW